MAGSTEEAKLGFDARPVYTLWQERCRHGDLFVVQAEGGELSDQILRGGVNFLMKAMPHCTGFVTLYDLTAGLTGFVKCAPAWMEFALQLRASSPGKQKAVIIVSPREAERSWTRWFAKTIPREGVYIHTVATLEEAWAVLEAPTLEETETEDGGSVADWVDLMPSM